MYMLKERKLNFGWEMNNHLRIRRFKADSPPSWSFHNFDLEIESLVLKDAWNAESHNIMRHWSIYFFKPIGLLGTSILMEISLSRRHDSKYAIASFWSYIRENKKLVEELKKMQRYLNLKNQTKGRSKYLSPKCCFMKPKQ